MAQTDIVFPSDLGAFYAAQEGSYAAGGTDVRIFPITGSFGWDKEQEQLAVTGARVRPNDTRAPVQGRKSAKAKFDMYLQPDPTVLGPGATPPTSNPLTVVLGGLLGAGPSFAAGSDLTGSPTAGGSDVTGGTGANFPAGSLVAIDRGSGVFEVARILTRSTDTLTWYPNLGATPIATADINNLITFYPNQTNTRSLEINVCSAQSSSYQYQLVGCTGEMELTFKLGELPRVGITLEGANWTGPSALGLAITHTDDTLNDPVSTVGAICILQSIATSATRTNVTIDDISIKIQLGNQLVETLTGGTQNKRAVAKTKDLEKTGCTIEVTVPTDTDYDTAYAAQTAYTLMFVCQATQATKTRFVMFDAPRCRLVMPPAPVKGGDGLQKMKLTFQCDLDQSCTGSTTALATAPWRLGIG